MKRFAQLLMIAGMLSMFACSSNASKTETTTDTTTVKEATAPVADSTVKADTTATTAAPEAK
ncbi:MAG TPA: hypothetical protein VMW01_16260 [Williamwhitmania sp.]|nr:hypothetical protein [Williamwhitmania sp.]